MLARYGESTKFSSDDKSLGARTLRFRPELSMYHLYLIGVNNVEINS